MKYAIVDIKKACEMLMDSSIRIINAEEQRNGNFMITYVKKN